MVHKPSGIVSIPISGEGTMYFSWGQEGNGTRFILDPHGDFGGPWSYMEIPTPEEVTLTVVTDAFENIMVSARSRILSTAQMKEQMLRMIERQFGS